MSERIAFYALALSTVALPLIWLPYFSDFDGAKWVVILAVCILSLPLLFRSGVHAGKYKYSAGTVLASLYFPSIILGDMALFVMLWLAILVLPNKTRKRPIFAGLATLATYATLTIGVFQERGLFGDWVPYRAGSFAVTLGNAGHVAEFAVVALPMIWMFCRRMNWVWSIAYSLPAAALVIRSDSRAGLLAMVAGIALWILLQRTQQRTAKEDASPLWMAGGAFGLLLFAVAVLGAPTDAEPHPIDRLLTVADSQHPTNEVRTELWRAAWKMRGSHSAFEDSYPAFRSAREWDLSGFDSVVKHPHNEFLHLLVTKGAFGVFLLCLLGICLKGFAQSIWRRNDAEDRDQLICAAAQWMGVGVMALFWAPFGQPTICFFLVLGTGLAFRPKPLQMGVDAERRPKWIFAVAFYIALMVANQIMPNRAYHTLSRDAVFVSRRNALEQAKRNWASSPSPDTIRRLRETSTSSLQLISDSSVSRPAKYRMLLALTDIFDTMTVLASQKTVSPEERDRYLSVIPLRDLHSAFPPSIESYPHVNTFLLKAQFSASIERNLEASRALEEIIRFNPATPRARMRLAAIAGEAGLPDRAIKLLEEELTYYGHSQRSDPTWELLARTTGWATRIEDGHAVVARWIASLGTSIHRQTVGGAIALHMGETRSSVGAFLKDPEPFSDREERGRLFAASLAGMEPKEQHARCLAHIFEHPHDASVLDALGAAISMELSESTGATAKALRLERYRALARAKVLHAWDDHEMGEDARAWIFIRLASKANEENHDVHLLRVILHLDAGNEDQAVKALFNWRQKGMRDFRVLDVHPLTAAFHQTPRVREAITAWGK